MLVDTRTNGAAGESWAPLLQSVDKQCERLLSLPSEIALRAMNPPVWVAEARPAKPVLDHRAECMAPTLAQSDASLLNDLVRDGICLTSLQALGLEGTADMMAGADDLSDLLARRAGTAGFMAKHTITAHATELLERDSILRWGLQDRLLNLVEAYLGVPAAYDGALMYHSRPDGQEQGIRKWHRDREDEKVVKIGIYVSDVEEDDGPFQVFRPELQAQIEKRLSWRYAKLTQQGLDIAIRDRDWSWGVRTVTGQAGTVFICDAARAHHRGKPPTRNARTAIFHSYFSRTPRHPFYCERSNMTRRELAEFAATLPSRARDCALWREQLPLSQRLIPRNRLTI